MKNNIDDDIIGIQSDNNKIREKHFNNLLQISEKQPLKLYKYWDVFIEILQKSEVSNKYYAIHLIPNLISIDKQNKFEKIFDEFYVFINHESPVVACHVAEKSVKIINAKHKMANKICKILLNIDSTSKCKQLELQKAYVISTLDNCFELFNDKEKIIEFVKKQLNSNSPKTVKMAKEFLKKYE